MQKEDRMNQSNIILIGFMGSGKSSVGQQLSQRMNKVFLDTDIEIEERIDMKIKTLFETKGEQAFRNIETSLLREYLNSLSDSILATDGGMPLRTENIEMLKELGVILYLKASADEIYERLRTDDTRPLLKTDDPRMKIEQLLQERAPMYEQAAMITVETDGKTPDWIAEDIIRCLDS